jgi:hypothetical protein
MQCDTFPTHIFLVSICRERNALAAYGPERARSVHVRAVAPVVAQDDGEAANALDQRIARLAVGKD